MLLSSHSCQIFVPSPAPITPQPTTRLDLFITNVDPSPLKAGNLIYDISDYLPVFMFVSQFTNAHKRPHSEFSYRLTTETLCVFSDYLGSAKWNDVFAANDRGLAYNSFIEKFSELYLACFLVKTIKTCKKSRKPWINKEYPKLRRNRDQLFKAFIV